MNKLNNRQFYNSVLKFYRANSTNVHGFIIFVFIIGTVIGQSLYKDYQARIEKEKADELREKNLITSIAKARQYADRKEWKNARSVLPYIDGDWSVTQNSKIADSLDKYYSIFTDSIDAYEARQRDSIAAIENRQRVISAAGQYHAEKIIVTTGPPTFETKGEPVLNITIKFSLFKSGKFRFVIRSFAYRDPYRTLIENYGEGTFNLDAYNHITFIEDNSSYLEDYPKGHQGLMDHSQWLIGTDPYDERAPRENNGFVFFKEK
jgi:4-amino-4-deoxy-L-arabinose transferase-like glycosyltransferase